MAASKYYINENMWLGTLDRYHPKTIYLEGRFWLEPCENANVALMESRVKREIKKYFPKNLTILEIANNLTERNHFFFQIHFPINLKTKFRQYCERLAPIISHRMPLFLDIITECGFVIHKRKKSV